ncbi:hypothetical protein GCM10018987_27140 [Streptomyces cremeus]
MLRVGRDGGGVVPAGASETQLVYALALLLPNPATHPFGFAQSRLLAKLPPDPLGVPMAECLGCGAAGRPGELPGGLCRPCRSTTPARERSPSPEVVRGEAARVRREMRAAREDAPRSRRTRRGRKRGQRPQEHSRRPGSSVMASREVGQKSPHMSHRAAHDHPSARTLPRSARRAAAHGSRAGE